METYGLRRNKSRKRYCKDRNDLQKSPQRKKRPRKSMVYLQIPAMERLQGVETPSTNLWLDPADLKHKTKSKMLKEYEQKMGKTGNKRPLSRIPLWYFLHEILEVERCRDLIEWEDEQKLIFTIKKPKDLAILWGQIKNKDTMTYPKLARGIRYYYGKGVIEKFNGKRFCYQFIVSRKTKAILSKRKHLPVEVEILPKKYKDRKRKSPTPDSESSPMESKKRWERRSTDDDQPSIYGSDWGSDEDDSFSESDWKNLDTCLADIFSDQRFETIFTSDEKMQSALLIPKTEPNDEETFIMNRSPIDLSSLPALDDMSSVPSYEDDRSNSIQSLPEMADLSSPTMDIYDIYKQLTEEASSIRDPYQMTKNTYQLSPTWHPNRASYRKKSRSESEVFHGFFNGSTANQLPSNLHRLTNPIGSLPDFPTMNSSHNEGGIGYYTNFLLDQESSFLQDNSFDADSVVDDILDL